MRNRSGFSNLFSHDRKTLYVMLSVVMISVLTLTVVYAALSTTLQINGQAEVSAASWNIYLDNVQLNSRSVTSDVPTITNSTTATFSTTLSKPGDFYEFSIDVVNNGSIDAMIDSVTKTPDLTDIQKKYLNYIVEYQNGELISNKQLVEKNSFVRLKVKVEFRKDISASDLPTTSETLSLSFKVNYVQADTSGTNVIKDGVRKELDIISGDLETVGSEVAIEDEHFYIIASDEDSVTMLAKYNLYVGGVFSNGSYTDYGDKATGLQDSTMIAYKSENLPINGSVKFSSTDYWSDKVNSYPSYVYDSNSTLYNYIENYKAYLHSQGVNIKEARLIKYEELIALGCSNSSHICTSAPSWVYKTSYWTGSASSNGYVLRVISHGGFAGYNFDWDGYGVRPVITISI